eukprot:2084998-Rhodomonas_salina.2
MNNNNIFWSLLEGSKTIFVGEIKTSGSKSLDYNYFSCTWRDRSTNFRDRLWRAPEKLVCSYEQRFSMNYNTKSRPALTIEQKRSTNGSATRAEFVPFPALW